jgi:hypothetical protein
MSADIRKVLQPANSIKVFRGFPRSQSKFHVLLRASHAALLMVSSKFRPTAALKVLDQNFNVMQPFERDVKINSDHAQ